MSIIPCCIANANGAHCNCRMPDVSVLLEQCRALKAEVMQLRAERGRPKAPFSAAPCRACARPLVEHHAAARASFARCLTCGRTAPPVHWPDASPPDWATTAALAAWKATHAH